MKQNLIKLKDDNNEKENEIVELRNRLDKLGQDKSKNEKEIEDLKKKNENLEIKLNEMQLTLFNKKLNAKSFKVEIYKSKKQIEIIFQQNIKEDIYEMVIKGKNKKENEEHINLLDIDSFLINDKDKNRIDIEYNVRN